jgi:ABC-2 type transport system ATP-binding protein
MSAALEITELTVHYGKRVAVDGLSLTLRDGEIVAMLGPNGAGKSTALLATAGALLPSHGTVRARGADLAVDPLVARARIGLADQPPSLYEFFTVAEHVEFVARTRGASDAVAQQELLSALGMGQMADRLCRELSFGMRQRVGLAAALVGDVSVILLDETLNGLDPRAAKSAREVLEARARAGAAILMSTHLLGVAERLCHRILVMDAGKLKADVSGSELERLLAGGPGAIEELYLSLVTEEETR